VEKNVKKRKKTFIASDLCCIKLYYSTMAAFKRRSAHVFFYFFYTLKTVVQPRRLS